MSIPVCNGGSAAPGVSSLTFTNTLPQAVTITSCTMPGWPATNPVVPAAGSKVVQLATRTVTGSYTYTTDPFCTPPDTNPKIVVS